METLRPLSDTERLQVTSLDVKRLLTHAAAGSTDQAEDVYRVPVEHFGPDRWRRECDEVFKRVPLLFGFSFDLPGPDTYLTIEPLGVPVLLTRDRDGQFRALINVCAHRGVCLVRDECGSARRFRCTYHGWTFENDGRLVGLTSEHKFGNVDRGDYSLVELPSEERDGVLWACLTPGLDLDLDAWLGPAAADLESMQLGTCHPFGHEVVPSPHWKATMDGFLETYHNPWLHPVTRAYFDTDLNLFEMKGRHAVLKPASANLRSASEQPEERWNLLELTSKVLFLFPNTLVGVNFPSEDLPGMQFACFRIFPGATMETSVTHFDIFTSEPAETAAQVKAVEDRLEETVRVVGEEDYPVVATQMKSWTSGGLSHMTYGRNEFLNQMWLHRGLADMLDGPATT